jgi:hypothetical protein
MGLGLDGIDNKLINDVDVDIREGIRGYGDMNF